MIERAPTDSTDEALLERALRDRGGPKGRAAASALLARHQRRVYLWSRRYVRDHDRALDVAQEVLVSAYKGLESYQGRSRFSSWLFAITRNKCLNAVAARSWKFDPEADLEALPSPDGPPEQALESEQERERLRAVLARHLDAEERNALWMLVEERMSIEQITHVLRLGNATGARGLLQRARRKLRAALDPQDLRMPS